MDGRREEGKGARKEGKKKGGRKEGRAESRKAGSKARTAGNKEGKRNALPTTAQGGRTRGWRENSGGWGFPCYVVLQWRWHVVVRIKSGRFFMLRR